MKRFAVALALAAPLAAQAKAARVLNPAGTAVAAVDERNMAGLTLAQMQATLRTTPLPGGVAPLTDEEIYVLERQLISRAGGDGNTIADAFAHALKTDVAAHHANFHSATAAKSLATHIDTTIAQFKVAAAALHLHVEDYSSTLLADAVIQGALGAINAELGRKADSPHRAQLMQRVADVLVFAGLIASQEDIREPKGANVQVLWRAGLEPIHPLKAAIVLGGLAQGYANDNLDTGMFAGVGYVEGDTIGKRMLRMTLVNLRAPPNAIRASVTGNPLYVAMLAGSDAEILALMLGSGGPDEQYFLNTCPLSARNTDIAQRVPNPAALIEVGRDAATRMANDVAGDAPSAAARLSKAPGAQKAGDLVTERVTEARNVFTAMQNALIAMLNAHHVDETAVDNHRVEWSRVMQKLGGAVGWKHPADVPQLTKKVFDNHYYASVFPGFFIAIGQVVNPKARSTKRTTAPDLTGYINITDAADRPVGGADRELQTFVDLNDTGTKTRRTQLTDYWAKLYLNGGTLFGHATAVGGHSLWMKAILRNGVKVFAINDPMVRGFAFKTFEEMGAFIDKVEPDVPGNLL